MNGQRSVSRRRFLRGVALTAGLVAAAGLVPACETLRLGQKERLVIWTDATFAPAADDFQTQAIDEWAKKKGVEVENVRETGENVQKKLQAAIESRQFPDISQASGGRFTLFYPARVFLDVSDLYQEFAKQWGGFYKPGEKFFTKEGKQWGLPYSIDANLILYWRDILEEGGVREFPRTWAEFYDVAKRLQKPPDLYGVGFQIAKVGDAENTFSIMMWDFGASLVGPDSRTVTVKSPEMAEFLEFVKKTWDMGVYPPGVTGWDNASNNTALQDRKVIFIHNPASPLVWFRNNKPELLPKIGVAGVPAGPKAQLNYAYVRDGFVLFNTGNDKRLELAKDLMRYLYSPEVYRKWVSLTFPAPAVAGMEDMDIWKNPQRRGFLEAAKTGVLDGYPGEPTPAYAELSTRYPVMTMITRVIVDRWPIPQAIDEVEKIARDVYSKYYK